MPLRLPDGLVCARRLRWHARSRTPSVSGKPVETVFDDMISTQDKAQQRLDAAREAHREALERQLEASE
jgi:hypothetical protein